MMTNLNSKKTLYEASRNQSVQKARTGDDYAPNNQDKGKNRFFRRTKQKVSASVSEYNKLNMNKLFNDDILDVNIKVKGETDDYLVRVSFSGVLNNIHKLLNGKIIKLDTRILMRALVASFNGEDVYFNCTCPDFKYRHAYWASRNSLIAGDPETRPSDITNPNDTKGGCCKHVTMVLTNNSWLLKVAAVIRNYVLYMEKNYDKLYKTIIYPSIYEIPYDESPAEVPEDDTLLPTSDKELTDIGNITRQGRDSSGRFIKGNQYEAKPKNIVSKEDDENDVIIGNNNSNKSFNFDANY